MNLAYIEQNAIPFGGLIYRPALIPVDYCGLLAYTAALALIDGRTLRASSFELLDEGLDEEARCVATVAILAGRVREAGVRPACVSLDPPLTVAYRALCGLPAVTHLVSACLAGELCRYDGTAQAHPEAVRLVESGLGVPICPECAGGLPCPRPPCELRAGRVVTEEGDDCTAAYLAGARRIALVARQLGVRSALLKEKSPSCGVKAVYDGSFCGVLIGGEGLAAAALRELGLALCTEGELL